MADPAILVGDDRVIVAANSRMDKLFGWEESGLTGQLIDVLIPPAKSEAHPDWMAAFFDRPASRSMSENPVIEGVHRNGNRVQVGISLTPVFHAEALEVAGKRLESERVRAEALVTQTAVLESEAKAKAEFLSSVSHEFKTPLTSVVAFTSLLMRYEGLSDRQLKQLNLIQSNAWRLERMINDLLHVAAADSGRLSYDIRQPDVVKMVKEVFDSLRPVATAANRRLVWRGGIDEAFAEIDPIRLAQAVQNVVSNAIKYSPAESGITISTSESDGFLEILVRNKG